MKAPGSWRFGAFELDPMDRRLMRDGKEISVPPKAFDVLSVLLMNAGRLVKREELFQAVWNGLEVEDANLTNNITILRRILGQRDFDFLDGVLAVAETIPLGTCRLEKAAPLGSTATVNIGPVFSER